MGLIEIFISPSISLALLTLLAEVAQLRARATSGEIQFDEDLGWTNWETSMLDNLRIGVLQRMEYLTVAMATDGLSMNYDRLGVKISGVNWRMPSNLKVTMTPGIADATNAKPVTTIVNLDLEARRRFGAVYNRLTCSTPWFQAMIATDEFKAKAALFLPSYITFTNLVTANLTQQITLAEQVLGKAIELYDDHYVTQANDGTEQWAPYLPTNLAVLSNTANDGNGNVMRFGNSVPTEVKVAQITGDGARIIGGTAGMDGAYGPLGYMEGEMNAPAITLWGVARGFPVKYSRTATAVIDGGTVSDAAPFTPYY